MNIEKMFDFLVTDYGLTYRFQEFRNCYSGNWIVQTYSFYNDSGCFTIHYLPQRDELSYFYSTRFSTVREVLCEKEIGENIIYSMEPKVWNKYSKVWLFKRPFFWYSSNKILRTFAEALKVYLSNNKSFFDIYL